MSEKSYLSWIIYAPKYKRAPGSSLISNIIDNGTATSPGLETIFDKLSVCITNDGVIALRKVRDETSENSLELQVDSGLYLLTLYSEDEKGEQRIRAYHNETLGKERVEILGDMWAACSICRDPAFVRNVFEEFVNTGDVSLDLLT